MKHYGLIGTSLVHSFSACYFTFKFKQQGIDAQYDLYPLPSLDGLHELLPKLDGLNVTVPYKQAVIPFLDELSPMAAAIGAVNVIEFIRAADTVRLRGHNTDAHGFTEALRPYLRPWHTQALVLGTGGASRAVCYALDQLGIVAHTVSRTHAPRQLTYADLTPHVIQEHTLIVNATPVGTFPDISACPPLPYRALTDQHLLFDLVYNPQETLFLQRGKAQNAVTLNGLTMLHEQAEAAWHIWNNTQTSE